MKNLRAIFYVMRIGEIAIRIIEKTFKYGGKALKRKKTFKKSKVNKISRAKQQ